MNHYLNLYQRAFLKYLSFRGRSNKEDFWTFYLGNILIILIWISLGSILIGESSSLSSFFSIMLGLFYFGILIPSMSVGARRMHDAGQSGWWFLIPFLNFFYALEDSDPGVNFYGPEPEKQVRLHTRSIIASSAKPSVAKQPMPDKQKVDVIGTNQYAIGKWYFIADKSWGMNEFDMTFTELHCGGMT